MKLFRFLLVVTIAVGLLLAPVGCASVKTALTSGPVDFVCNPTLEQEATATAMLAALDAAQVAASTFYPVAGIFKASAVLTTIKNGGCFLVAELKDAFAVVDVANNLVASTGLKMLKEQVSYTIPEYAPLRKLIK